VSGIHGDFEEGQGARDKSATPRYHRYPGGSQDGIGDNCGKRVQEMRLEKEDDVMGLLRRCFLSGLERSRSGRRVSGDGGGCSGWPGEEIIVDECVACVSRRSSDRVMLRSESEAERLTPVQTGIVDDGCHFTDFEWGCPSSWNCSRKFWRERTAASSVADARTWRL